MLANSPKDNQLSPVETGALYYFPEIPCSADKDRSSASTPNHFIGGALDRNDDHSIADEDLQDSEQVCGLIEEAFNNWRGSNEQIDDVCLLGVRVSFP